MLGFAPFGWLTALCHVMQDNKWWNGIITDFNGLTGEHWYTAIL